MKKILDGPQGLAASKIILERQECLGFYHEV